MFFLFCFKSYGVEKLAEIHRVPHSEASGGNEFEFPDRTCALAEGGKPLGSGLLHW